MLDSLSPPLLFPALFSIYKKVWTNRRNSPCTFLGSSWQLAPERSLVSLRALQPVVGFHLWTRMRKEWMKKWSSTPCKPEKWRRMKRPAEDTFELCSKPPQASWMNGIHLRAKASTPALRRGPTCGPRMGRWGWSYRGQGRRSCHENSSDTRQGQLETRCQDPHPTGK